MSPPASPRARLSRTQLTWVAMGLALAIGATLRFTWNRDMEFKGDEAWMYSRAVRVGRTEPWPMLGMPSGVGLRNPGFSVWLFVDLARLTGAVTPLQVDRAVVALNVAALVLLALFILKCAPEEDREIWLWALALAAVSPMGLILQRKIWAQSTLPFFCVAFLWGWWRREQRLGAAIWGLFGGLLGQIHMSGFFFALAFLLVTAFAAWRKRSVRPAWIFWLLGSLLAAIPLLPWVKYVLSGQDHSPPWSWAEVSSLYGVRAAFDDMFGLELDYSLTHRYGDYLRFPGPWGSIGPGRIAEGVSFAVGIALLLFAARGLLGEWRQRQPATSARPVPDLILATVAALPVFLALLTLSGAEVFRHYLHITYPFEGVAVALLALRYAPAPRAWLGALVAAQLATCVTFLTFIHVNGGAIGGGYGRAYGGD